MAPYLPSGFFLWPGIGVSLRVGTRCPRLWGQALLSP